MSQVYLSNQHVDQTVYGILANATCEANKLYLNSPQLDRKTYESVDDVLKRLGGKWKGGKTKAHVFPYDPQPLLEAVLDSRMMPLNNPLDFYQTPPAVVQELMTDAEMRHIRMSHHTYRVLEPSAGRGAIADALWAQFGEHIELDLVEMNPLNIKLLRDKGYAPLEANFLDFETDRRYDRIIMNPPFTASKDKKAYQKHITHAFSLLNRGGLLVSVAPGSLSFRQDDEDFDTWITRHGHRRELPKEAFKDSGTNVATCIIAIRNEDQSWRKQWYAGWPSWDTWCLALYSNNDYEDYQAHTRLAERIERGELGRDLLGYALPETDKAIREHYRSLMRKYRREYHECIQLEEWEWQYMVQWFLDNLESC
jgi:predicted RNA methylase